MRKLNVWLSLAAQTAIHAGELIATDPDPQRGGTIHGQFRYSREYLNWGEAFALDPIHLPLSAKIYDANRPHSGIHAVFEDSLPDDWGRRILARKHHLPRDQQRPAQLLGYLAGDGMGALSYSEGDIPPPRLAPLGSHYLVELQSQAARFEEDPATVDAGLALLFQAGSSAGGARPKVLIEDNDRAWLAKFASSRDQFDVVALEAAAMELAGRAGVEPAGSRSLPCDGKKVLLVERFDFIPQSQERRHVISMKALLGAEGYYSLSYRHMADVLRRVSSAPAEDLPRLFRQLVFNALIGNTDDHLQNFAMVSDGRSWRLSPAFDLLPNVGQNSEQVLAIDNRFVAPDRPALLREAKSFGLKQRQKAEAIIDEVWAQLQAWEEVFSTCAVPQKDREIIGRDITSRLRRGQAGKIAR